MQTERAGTLQRRYMHGSCWRYWKIRKKGQRNCCVWQASGWVVASAVAERLRPHERRPLFHTHTQPELGRGEKLASACAHAHQYQRWKAFLAHSHVHCRGFSICIRHSDIIPFSRVRTLHPPRSTLLYVSIVPVFNVLTCCCWMHSSGTAAGTRQFGAREGMVWLRVFFRVNRCACPTLSTLYTHTDTRVRIQTSVRVSKYVIWNMQLANTDLLFLWPCILSFCCCCCTFVLDTLTNAWNCCLTICRITHLILEYVFHRILYRMWIAELSTMDWMMDAWCGGNLELNAFSISICCKSVMCICILRDMTMWFS